MKKILCYLAAGAVALGAISCVKDQESSSVTAVRQAKAAELLSIAELNKAQAEAAKTTANAEAALKAAQAEYQKSLAEYQKAMAEYQRALADKTGAEAEAIREKMKQDQERFELEKQKILIEIERIRAEADAQIAAYRLSVKKIEQEIADLADERIKKLFAEYSSLVSELSGERTLLLNEQTRKLQAESELVSLQASASQTEVEYNRMIAGKKAFIETLKAHKEHQPDHATLEPLIDAKWEEIDALRDKISENEQKTYNESEETLSAKYNETDKAQYRYTHDGITVRIPILSRLIDLRVVNRIEPDDDAALTYINGLSEPVIFMVPKVNSALIENAKNKIEKDIRDYMSWLGKEGDTMKHDGTLYAQYAYFQDMLEKAAKDLSAKKDAMADAEKARADAKQAHLDAIAEHEKAHEALEAAHKAYDNAVEAEANAQEAYDAEDDAAKKAELLKALDEARKAAADAATALGKAGEADTEAEKAEAEAETKFKEAKDAYKTAVSDYEAAQTWKVQIEDTVIVTKDNIDYFTAKIAKMQATLDNFDTAVSEAFSGQEAFVKEMLSLAEARDKAKAAYDKAQEDLNILVEEYRALLNLWNYADYASYEQSIADAEADIARYTQYIEDAKNAAGNKEESIKLIEKRIADIEARIKVLEKLVDNAKKALDTALAAE